MTHPQQQPQKQPSGNDGILQVAVGEAAPPPPQQQQQQPSDGRSNNDKRKNNDRPDYRDRDDLVYKSGIPTLRASAHRVKCAPKHRTHNPCPKNNENIETGTLWLPKEICQEDVMPYDTNVYNFVQIISDILQQCDSEIVGSFRDIAENVVVMDVDDDENDVSMAHETKHTKLEDFVVCPKSTWRTVNGGQCELAQQYLSDQVSTNPHFLDVFDDFVIQVVLPHLKQKLLSLAPPQDSDNHNNGTASTVSSSSVSTTTTTAMTFYYQRPPTLRLQPGPAWAQVKAHNDAEYGHQYGELNYWVPLTDRALTGVDLYCESNYERGDYHPVPAEIGEAISFHGSSCRHYVNTNSSSHTRISFDFRVGVKGYFDPEWEMKGTNDDHSRCQVTI